jgi:hypothetical protein
MVFPEAGTGANCLRGPSAHLISSNLGWSGDSDQKIRNK